MDKIFYSLLVADLLLGASAACAWEILSFDADLTVQQDGSLSVEETIEADFQGEPKHGIYRDIPLQTQDRLGIKRSIRIAFLGALDERESPWEAKLTREGFTAGYGSARKGPPTTAGKRSSSPTGSNGRSANSPTTTSCTGT